MVARERVTAALEGRAAELRAFGFRGVRGDELRFLRAVRLGVRRFADREGFGLRDEDFTDNSPGMTAVAMVRYYLRSTSRKEV